ncbi:MAG: acyl-CoA thioesterase [Chloroflexi bacterium]|nr:acyl-CoA thioesterase [Chloroflexota bacterium]MBI3733305.1 acyl-CoA thioesterase [Chloroflexota bacterium]
MTDTPSPFKFSTSFKVRWVETDLQGVVFFGHYLTYFDEALMEYLEHLNFAYHQIKADGYDWVYAESRVQYKGALKLADRIAVHVRVSRIGNSSVTAEFQIFAHARFSILIATGDVTFVVVDNVSRRPTRVPDSLRQSVAQYQGD